MVKIPDDSKGKLLTIKLQSDYKRFSGKVGEIYMGKYSAIFVHVREKYVLSLIVGMVIGFIGCLILLVSAFAIQKKPQKAEIALGILFIVTSLWLCGEAKMPVYKSFFHDTILFCVLIASSDTGIFLSIYLFPNEGKK